MKPNYVSLKYNSRVGYELVIDSDSSRTRAIFNNICDTQEYLKFKAGKVISNKFKVNFNEIKQVIIENGFNYDKIIDVPAFVWNAGDKYTTVR